ncbi:endoglucanase [Streptomyces yokosukanensis]|uniref:Glucanase n=1 Tax=Streptomyces yokosukanensis TaxID=67386 RepID=A0A101NZH6_9ACTN|nr:glycoside hydrolase family 6 protein [Streptomyces yokosukanensis]KUN02160.1 endoglucanase [Streptomyces yokosukanensis]
MVTAASAVTLVGSVTGIVVALGSGQARTEVTHTADAAPATAAPSPSPSTPDTPSAPSAKPTPRPTARIRTPAVTPGPDRRRRPAGPVSPLLYRHPESQVLDWVRAHPGDPRTAVIAARIADRPAAVWFADPDPGTIAARVGAVTAGAAARHRVPVLVPYAIPDRDCGGASRGGAPDLAVYDAWIDAFARGLGPGEVIVVLEPDSIAQSDCLTRADRAARFASLARAGRVLKAADPRARVYYDAGHSGWNPPGEQAALLKQAGAAGADGVFSNVSNFRTTADEIAYDRRVLAALGGPARLGAVIDTSRNGNGAPSDGQWCDPAGRRIGRAPTLDTGEARIDAYLWVKPPGESDGCRGAAGTFTPSYAYDLARGVSVSPASAS